MKFKKLFQIVATFITGIGLPICGYPQVFYYSGPATGFFEMKMNVDGIGEPYPNPGTVCDFNTLNETIYLDTSAQTIRQVGTISVSPISYSTTISYQYPDPRSPVYGMPQTLSLSMAVDNGLIPFDTGPVSYADGFPLQNPSFTASFGGSYTWITGQDTFSGSFTFDGDFQLYPFTTFTVVDPSTIILASPDSHWPNQKPLVVYVQDTNGTYLSLNPGGQDSVTYSGWSGTITATVPEPTSTRLTLLGSILFGLAICRRYYRVSWWPC